MPRLIKNPTEIKACGNKPKIIREYIGRVNSKTDELSIAHMTSPAGWEEAGQTPEFNEYTVVLKGMLRVQFRDGSLDVQAGQAVITRKGEWVKYSTPGPIGADYMAVCKDAFSLEIVQRDPDKI